MSLSTGLRELVFENFGAQLGEMLWYEISVDPRVAAISEGRVQHFREAFKHRRNYPRRILELAPFSHYTGHLLTSDAEVILCDISADSLRAGARNARGRGIDNLATMVAADFHNLPFPDASFDFIFVASAIHHSRNPRRVLSEMARVLAEDGIIFIFNEPVRRSFSFFKFRANRRGELGPTESKLHDRGVLRLLTSYLAHSRPEELFGMVENNQITFDDYMKPFENFDVIERTIDWRAGLSEFDARILGERCEESFDSNLLARRISGVLEGLTPTDNEILRGIDLPDKDEIDSLAKAIAPRIKNAQSDEEFADIFGAALRMKLRRRNGRPLTPLLSVNADYELEDGVYQKNEYALGTTGFSIDLRKRILPPIQQSQAEHLSKFYPISDWQLERSERGLMSLAPKVATPVIRLSHKQPVVVLIRLYASFPNNRPYQLIVSNGKEEIVRIVISAAESRLIRFLCIDADEIVLHGSFLTGEVMRGILPIRLQAAQTLELIKK